MEEINHQLKLQKKELWFLSMMNIHRNHISQLKDENHQIIVGKSDTNQDIFDTIIFANRDIEQVTIPNTIKYIKPNAFEYCHKLNSIEFSEDSKLTSLCNSFFSSTPVLKRLKMTGAKMLMIWKRLQFHHQTKTLNIWTVMVK